MAVTYVIDGYNLLLSHGPVEVHGGPQGLARAREALLFWLARQRGENEELVVIFDASNAPRRTDHDTQWAKGVRVCYAAGHESADAKIAHWCWEARGQAARMVVVSDDRAVQRGARSMHVSVLDGAAFIRQLARSETRQTASREASEKPGPPDAAERDEWRCHFALPAVDESLERAEASKTPQPREPSSAIPPPVKEFEPIGDGFLEAFRQTMHAEIERIMREAGGDAAPPANPRG